jgi:DNA gyrase subunit A
MMKRALGDEGFAIFTEERGLAETYALTPVQADAILRMTLGQLVNLEQEKLGEEFRKLLEEIAEHRRILGDDKHILAIIREDILELKKRYADDRRTAISGEEVGTIDMEDLIAEETMVVTISHAGYIKRTPASVYRSQRRGGKGIKGAKTAGKTEGDDDPVEHLFVASTHAYLLFFTNRGKVYWLKVYDIPQAARDSRGRAIINLLRLGEGEKIAECWPVREFGQDEYLMMATRNGLVKKTELAAYSRPMKGGIIAIKLRADEAGVSDELVNVAITRPGDEVVLSTATGMAIRFSEADARPMGRATSGVKGINLSSGDSVVGMVVTEPDATLLTACQNGYGKRTPFGASEVVVGPPVEETDEPASDSSASGGRKSPGEPAGDTTVPLDIATESGADSAETEGASESSNQRYRTQRRGGKGLRDIKTTQRNGPVVGIVSVRGDDEVMMISARGKIQRIKASDVSVIGRNTQGVRIMGLDEGDTLAAVVRVPRVDTNGEEE